MYALLHAVMRSALEEEEPPLIQANPIMIRGGSQAGAPKTKKIVATPQQVDELAAAMPERLALAVYLGAWCQTRNGEAMALRRRDVTPERICITRGVTWVHGEPVFGPPKTDAGTREIAVPPHIAPKIREHLLAHANPGPDGLLFPAHPGQDRPMHQNTYAYYQAQARKATSLPETFRYHHLRHTGLTWAAQVGGTLAELQARAGHARPSTAMLYQHSTKTRDEALAEALSEQIAGRPKRGQSKNAGRGSVRLTVCEPGIF